jgi:hypothetical protein
MSICSFPRLSAKPVPVNDYLSSKVRVVVIVGDVVVIGCRVSVFGTAVVVVVVVLTGSEMILVSVVVAPVEESSTG